MARREPHSMVKNNESIISANKTRILIPLVLSFTWRADAAETGIAAAAGDAAAAVTAACALTPA